MTPGTPEPFIAGDPHRAFPGSVCLGDGRKVVSWGAADAHTSTVGTREMSVDGGTPFTHWAPPGKGAGAQDQLAVIDGKLVSVVYERDAALHKSDGRILLIDETAPDLSVGWDEAPIDPEWRAGTVQNFIMGQVFRHGARYGVGFSTEYGSGNRSLGVLWSDALDDWSSVTERNIANYVHGRMTEICVRPLADGTLLALLRRDDSVGIYRSTSTDGDSWTTPAFTFSGHGYPAWIEYAPGRLLTVYRDAPNGHSMWRTSSDGGASWSPETLLDATGARNAYASFILNPDGTVDCYYGVEHQASNPITDADVRHVVFTPDPVSGFTVTVPPTLTVTDAQGVQHEATVVIA